MASENLTKPLSLQELIEVSNRGDMQPWDRPGYLWWHSDASVQQKFAQDVRERRLSIGTMVRGIAVFNLEQLPVGSRALAMLQDHEAFVSPTGVAYICLPALSPNCDLATHVAVPVYSNAVAEHMQQACNLFSKKALGRPAIQEAQRGLDALARAQGMVKEVSVRRWYDADAKTLWVDLGRTPNGAECGVQDIMGWCDALTDAYAEADTVETTPGRPPGYDHRWERTGGFLGMPFDWKYWDDLCAMRDSDLPSIADELRPFVNAQDEDALRKMVAWLIGAWHPYEGPYKLLYLSGPTGVAKTMTQRRLAQLVDPRAEQVQSAFPKDEDAIQRRALRQGVLVYDNLTEAPPWFQKTLAQLATGYQGERGGQPFNIRRPVMANGLNYVFTAPDLHARTLVAELRPFPYRIPDNIMDAQWEAARPRLQALLLRVVSVGLARYADVAASLHSQDRLASFEAWLVACEPATGLPEGTFQQLLHSEPGAEANGQSSGLLPEGQALLKLLRDIPTHTWTGTGKQLVTALGFATMTAPVLMRRLKQQKDGLVASYGLTWSTRHSGETLHTFTLKAPA